MEQPGLRPVARLRIVKAVGDDGKHGKGYLRALPPNTEIQTMTIYGYTRVSSAEQADSHLGLSAQRTAIEGATATRGWTDIEWIEDAGYGRGKSGPALLALLDRLDKGDVLVVSKLDRLARSLIDYLKMVELSEAGGWDIVALDVALDTTTPTGKLVSNIMMAIAQWERENIGLRTRDALAEAKRRGVKLGRRSAVPDATRERILAWSGSGMTQQMIAYHLTRNRIPTPGGSATWSRQQVSRIIKQA